MQYLECVLYADTVIGNLYFISKTLENFHDLGIISFICKMEKFTNIILYVNKLEFKYKVLKNKKWI